MIGVALSSVGWELYYLLKHSQLRGTARIFDVEVRPYLNLGTKLPFILIRICDTVAIVLIKNYYL
eukprot:SAG22_NODE_9623_length_579_cov_0.762500_2_plen_64_part_01